MILSILKYRSMVPKKTFLVSVLATFGDIFLLHASVFSIQIYDSATLKNNNLLKHVPGLPYCHHHLGCKI